MTRAMRRPPIRRASPTQAGFTLLETVISLTILSLLMLVLYLAFSTAAALWSREGREDSRGQRQETVARLLADDFRGLRPYTLNWEQGQSFAFAGGPRTVFYVTTNGLGAEDRASRGLFFACLFLAPRDNGGLALYLHKSPYPHQGYFEALHDFSNSVGGARAAWQPPETLREGSTLLLDGLSEASFSFSPGRAGLPDEREANPFAAHNPLPQEDWNTQNLPALTQIEYMLGGQTFRALATAGTGGNP